MKMILRIVPGAVLLLLLMIGAVHAQTPTPTPIPVTVMPPTVTDDASAPAGWHRYQFGAEPVFSVVLPAAPESTAERVPSLPTAVVQLHISTAASGVFAATRVDGIGRSFENATEAERKAFFGTYIEGFARGFRESLKKNNINSETTFDEPTKATAASRDAFQQDFAVGVLKGRAQLVFAGSGAFCVLAIWPPDSPIAHREAFFNSFQLIGTPK
jgi:hypothetical protein